MPRELRRFLAKFGARPERSGLASHDERRVWSTIQRGRLGGQGEKRLAQIRIRVEFNFTAGVVKVKGLAESPRIPEDRHPSYVRRPHAKSRT